MYNNQFKKVETVFTLHTIALAAKELFEKYKHKKVWAFTAPMGAGKTTFINTLCKEVLQIEDLSSSPTFSIINEYNSPLFGKIYHLDLYRLKDEEEAIQAGVEDTLYSDAFLCMIEWPEKAAELLPEDVLQIQIDVIDQSTRKITAE